MPLRVIKKSGKKQPFSIRKIVTGIIKAGGTVELASDVVDHLRNWAHGHRKKTLHSREIRRQVVAGIFKKNKKLAKAYSGFKNW